MVDDDELIRQFVVRLMSQERCLVLSASNGEEALKVSRRYPGKIDVLITDIEMPGLKGTELVARLRVERPGIKALLITGSDCRRQDHALPVLAKPFCVETLKEKVWEIMAVS